MFQITKSGHVYYWEAGKKLHMECFDSLWFSKVDRHHFALTWEQGGAECGPGGLLVAYWLARPYAALTIDLGRAPTGHGDRRGRLGWVRQSTNSMCWIVPCRSAPIWELMQYRSGKAAELESLWPDVATRRLQRPALVRKASWRRAEQVGILVEAESADAIRRRKSKAARGSRRRRRASGYDAASGANVASGRAYVAQSENAAVQRDAGPGRPVRFGLRYGLLRSMHPLWPQNSSAKTPWSDNFATVRVHVDGRPWPATGWSAVSHRPVSAAIRATCSLGRGTP